MTVETLSPLEELAKLRDECMWYNPGGCVHGLCARYGEGDCYASEHKDSQQLLQYLFEEEVKPEVVEALVAAGADVNATVTTDAPKRGYEAVYSPLCLAVLGRRAWLVTKLLELGAKNRQVDDMGARCPMAHAAAIGDLACVRAFLDFGLAVDDGETTALLGAVEGKQLEIVQFLLRHGADPNRRNYGYQMIARLPLQAIAQFKYDDDNTISIARALLVAGADPSAKLFTNAPLVSQTRSVGVLRLLCAAGADCSSLAGQSVRYIARALLLSAVEGLDSKAMIEKFSSIVWDESQDWDKLINREKKRLREAKEELASERAQWFWNYEGGRQRALEICLGLAAMQLNSLVLVTIIEAELGFSSSALDIPFHLKWNLVVEIMKKIKKLIN